ncbi:MAG TPA: alpha/beta hydrolase, partial [Acetobacteraceae bacterium]|nr:alpha/beta hydrolase [Acetobacteraceae bacterium]
DYQKATRVFYDRHVCRIDPWPDDVARTFAAIENDPTVYTTMNGANEFFVTGTLRHWTIIDRLDRIAAPTLMMSGRHDEATEACVRPFADCIGGAEWQVFEYSSHMPHIEEREACMVRVADFLDRHA